MVSVGRDLKAHQSFWGVSVPSVVLLLCGYCHRELSCDLTLFPDRKKTNNDTSEREDV